MRKRILFVIEALSGGAGRHVKDLALGLSSKNYDIFILCGTDRTDDMYRDILMEKLPKNHIILCENLVREINLKNDVAAYQNIRRTIQNIRPNIVHCHSSKAGVVGRIAAKIKGVKKVFYTPHAYSFLAPEFSNKKKRVFVLIEKMLSRYATSKTFVVSEGELEAAIANNLNKKDKFEVIYNGLPEITLPPKNVIKEMLDLEEDTVVIGNNARLSEQKNPLLFLEIAKTVIETSPKYHFVWVGDGVLRSKVEKFIEDNSLNDNIHLLGDRFDAEFIVVGYDLFLITSLYEGLPYALIEAMRAGVPILATNVVGNREVVTEGINGHLIDKSRSTEFVQSILSNHKYDKREIRSIFDGNFTIESMIGKIEHVYDKDF